MDQNIKIIPDYQLPVLTPSIRRPDSNLMPVDYGGDLEVVEVAEELNDATNIKESSTFDADIPYNTNNRWIVNSYGNSIPVLVNAHGIQLQDRLMRVNGYSESSGQYDVSFVRSQDWPEVFKNLSLNQLDGFDPFQLSEAFIDDNQVNDAAYPGPNPTPTRGFYTPLAYYGGLNRFNQANSLFELTYADFRLWFHYGKILEQCFFAAGWKMDCPLLLTPYGQRLAWYLVGDASIYAGYRSGTYKDKLQLPATKHYSFRAERTTTQVITGIGSTSWWLTERIQFQDDSTAPNFDNGAAVADGFYNTTDFALQGFSGKWKYKIKLIIQGGAGAAIGIGLRFAPKATFAPVPSINAQYFDAAGNYITKDQILFSIPGSSQITTIEINATVESYFGRLDIGFGFYFGAGVTVLPGSYIEGYGEYIVPALQPGNAGFNDNINESIVFPQSWLSPKIKAIELLEDYCHRTNSKLYTDQARRIVGIYTEHDVPTYGVETEPYYFETIEQDLSLMQVENSAQVSLKDVVTPAKYILGFKETTDEYIASVQKETPFDAVIDMQEYGTNIDPDKEVENRSNLTEPTLERTFVEIKSPNPANIPISVMAVLDNLVGEPTTSVSPRTAYIYGPVRQRTAPGAVTYKKYVRRYAGITQTISAFAYATQFPSGELVQPSVATAIPNDKTLVYDHTQAVTEPMKRYWIDSIRILYIQQTRKLTVIVGSFNRFMQMNFRALYRLKFMGMDWKGRMVIKRTKLNDFRKVEIEVREDLP
jgi:hypothetical protein